MNKKKPSELTSGKKNTGKTISVFPSEFKSPGKDGDFGWMIRQDSYNDAFFIFNDNEEQFLEFQKNKDNAKGFGCDEGGGNAVIRPWQCKTPPRSGGIPTGSKGTGYKSLGQKTGAKGSMTVKELIDSAIGHIRKVVFENSFDRVYYSSDGKGGLGTGIFDVGDEVKNHIIEKINSAFK